MKLLSMLLNPNDEETRYNLALAQKLLEDQKNDENKDKDKEQSSNTVRHFIFFYFSEKYFLSKFQNMKMEVIYKGVRGL